jgi:hypothetical protein
MEEEIRNFVPESTLKSPKRRLNKEFDKSNNEAQNETRNSKEMKSCNEGGAFRKMKKHKHKKESNYVKYYR